MCRFPLCTKLSSSPEHFVGDLCLEHAIFVDDKVEEIIEYEFTRDKILQMILKEMIREPERLYLLNKKEFISATSQWDLIYKSIQKGLYKLKDYQDRLTLEEIIDGCTQHYYDIIMDDISKDFSKRCIVKLVY